MNTLNGNWDYCSAFITLACSAGCGYCIQRQDKFVQPPLMSASDWDKAFSRIPHDQSTPVTLTGGEPTTHPEFYDIINSCGIPFDLLTNGTFCVDEFMDNTSPRNFRRLQSDMRSGAWNGSIRISFHAWKAKDNPKYVHALLDCGFELSEMGYPVMFTCPDVPEDAEEIAQFEYECGRIGVPFARKQLLGWYDGNLYGTYHYPEGVDGKRKNCECKTSELLIAPDGKVYRCHRDLYASEGSIGHILNEDFTHESVYRPCANYGQCSMCDVLEKKSRTGQAPRCSVEIR